MLFYAYQNFFEKSFSHIKMYHSLLQKKDSFPKTKLHLSEKEISSFQQKISEMGYKFQFITLAGFHTQNIAIFELAEKYKAEGMAAYSKIQEREFAREKDGYTSVKHQREVGTSYFDAVSNTISSGKSSTTAMEGSTESEQF